MLKYRGVTLALTVSLLWVCLAFMPSWVVEQSSSLALLRTLTREIPQGHLNGIHRGPAIRGSFEILQPGDVILCHNRNGGYGYWTHSVIYVGYGKAVDADDFAKGTELESIDKYRNYDRVAVYRSTTSDETRQSVAARATYEVGKPYDPFSGMHNSHAEYCSKLIWTVFKAEGIALTQPQHWILPDDLANSSKLMCIAEWGGPVQHG